MTKLLLLDLDGTIRKTKSGKTFISKPGDQQIIEGVYQALDHFLDWFIFGITNQGDVASGYKSLNDCIREQQITLDLIPHIKCIFFCPDYEGKQCYQVTTKHYRLIEFAGLNFRKPNPGMLALAISEYIETADNILVVGDRDEDEQAAQALAIPFMWANEWLEEYGK
jgi:D-glycero-D-manno-heptose 1,7-bisphosphate phosphatase